MKDLNGQSNLSTLGADDWNQLPKEIENVIESSGLTLPDQLSRAISVYAGLSNWYENIGGADALQFIKNDKVIQATTQPLDGMRVRFRPVGDNTGATTLVLLGAGGPPRDVLTEAGAALTGGELVTTADAEFRYDSALDDWFLIGA